MRDKRDSEPERISRVVLRLIHRDPRGWPRHGLDGERVAEFVQLYEDGGLAALQPIEVVADGQGGYYLAEGNHRLEALAELDADEADVIVLQVPAGEDPLDVCFERGLVTAATAPLRLTRAEKRDAVIHLKDTRPSLSNRDIARLVGCSHQTVGRVLERSNGPLDSGRESPLPPADLEIATKLLRAIEKVYEARGLGIWDSLTGDHTGKRLAHALTDAYGDGALQFAERVRGWVEEAILELGRWS